MSLRGIEDFALERWFAPYEFAVRHQLGASDIEPYTLAELLPLADADARRRWDQLQFAYTETAGLPALREAIAAQYDHLEAEHVLVVAGAEEGIFLLSHALLGPGDDAVVVVPSFQSLHSVPRAIGARVHMVTLRHERAWALDPDEIAAVAGPKTRFIAINYPHNPTGAQISRDVQARIVEIAERCGAVLLSDEVYRGLESDEADRLPAGADLSSSAVSLGVMSKSFALPGLRIGWLATRSPGLLARVVRLKDYTTICSSAPSEILALIALRAAERVLRRSQDIVTTNREAARWFFTSHAGVVECVPSRAGSVVFPRLVGRDVEALAEALVQRESSLLVPGRVFGDFANHFRLGLGRRDLPVALEALARVLKR